MAEFAKALADPVRVQLVDVLRNTRARSACCELVPLFDLSQPTVSLHLKVFRQAGSSAPSVRAGGPPLRDLEALGELSTWSR